MLTVAQVTRCEAYRLQIQLALACSNVFILTKILLGDDGGTITEKEAIMAIRRIFTLRNDLDEAGTQEPVRSLNPKRLNVQR